MRTQTHNIITIIIIIHNGINKVVLGGSARAMLQQLGWLPPAEVGRFDWSVIRPKHMSARDKKKKKKLVRFCTRLLRSYYTVCCYTHYHNGLAPNRTCRAFSPAGRRGNGSSCKGFDICYCRAAWHFEMIDRLTARWLARRRFPRQNHSGRKMSTSQKY